MIPYAGVQWIPGSSAKAAYPKEELKVSLLNRIYIIQLFDDNATEL
jgi:hypothetical protein